MQAKSTSVRFDGQDFWLGIDVHSRDWKVTIRTMGVEVKTLVMPPQPAVLHAFMSRHFPGGLYHSGYEAGFSGFWAHRELQRLGFQSVVVHAADVPTSDKERRQKDDVRDSRKLARGLEKGELNPIHVPDPAIEELRSLCRLRERSSSHLTRLKNRIKGHLKYYGIEMTQDSAYRHWSGLFLQRLAVLSRDGSPRSDYLSITLDAVREESRRLATIMRKLRKHCREGEAAVVLGLLRSVPGIGPKAAFTLYTELQDISRFRNLNHLTSYIGLMPSTASSGEHEKSTGITPRRHRAVRTVLIESAWMAIRRDPVLLGDFSRLARSMKKQAAIVRIAKKLASRVASVWRTRSPYKLMTPIEQTP